MLSRTGTVLKQESRAKWTQSPSVLLSSAFRDLFGCDDADYESAKYLLEGDIYVFERNADTNTADLKVLYRLLSRKSGEAVFAKSYESAVPIRENTNAAFAEASALPAESLQQPAGEDGFSLEQVLGDWTQEERLVEYVALRQAIQRLPERERQVVFLRFYHGMTQQRASRVLGVSQVQVSRLERRAVDKLRELMA